MLFYWWVVVHSTWWHLSCAGSCQRARAPTEGEAGWKCISAGSDHRAAIKRHTAEPARSHAAPWWGQLKIVNVLWHCTSLVTAGPISLLWFRQGFAMWDQVLYMYITVPHCSELRFTLGVIQLMLLSPFLMMQTSCWYQYMVISAYSFCFQLLVSTYKFESCIVTSQYCSSCCPFDEAVQQEEHKDYCCHPVQQLFLLRLFKYLHSATIL